MHVRTHAHTHTHTHTPFQILLSVVKYLNVSLVINISQRWIRILFVFDHLLLSDIISHSVDVQDEPVQGDNDRKGKLVFAD